MSIDELIKAGAPRDVMASHIAALCWRPDVDCYYWGYSSHGSHALHGPDPSVTGTYGRNALIRQLGRDLDGGLCPRCEQTQGRALLTHGGGWTAIAFWDRSRDSRPNSNTAFIVRGTLSFEQIVRVARYRYPDVWQRFAFPIVQVDAQGREVSSATR